MQKSRQGAVTQVDNNVIVNLSEPNEPEVDNNVIVKIESDSSAPAIEDRSTSESASSTPEHQGALDPDLQLIEAGFTGLGLMTWESTVNNRLPLLNLPPDVLEVLRRGEIEYTKAKAIAQIKDEIELAACLKEAIDNNLCLSQISVPVEPARNQSLETRRFPVQDICTK